MADKRMEEIQNRIQNGQDMGNDLGPNFFNQLEALKRIPVPAGYNRTISVKVRKYRCETIEVTNVVDLTNEDEDEPIFELSQPEESENSISSLFNGSFETSSIYKNQQNINLDAPKATEEPEEPSDIQVTPGVSKQLLSTVATKETKTGQIKWAKPTHIMRLTSGRSGILVPVSECTQEEKEFLEMNRKEREASK